MLDELLTAVAGRAAAVAVVAATAWLLGRWATAPLGRVTTALKTTLGLVILALGVLALSALGAFRLEVVATLLLLLHATAIRTWLTVGRALASQRVSGFTGAVALGVGGAAALIAAAPPSGFDATMYHLPYATELATTGSLPFLPHLRFPVFPQLQECLFALGMMLGDDTVPALLQLLQLGLSAAVLRELTTRLASPRAGIWAAALWLGTPLVFSVGTQAYVDVALAMVTVASLTAFDHWREGDGGGWLIAAGGLAGAAAGTKYLGLLTIAGLAIACLLAPARGRRRLAAAGLVVVTAAAVAGPWYGRIVAWTGNPVFPYYAALFGESEWSPPEDHGADASGRAELATVMLDHLTDATTGLGDLVSAPWRSVLDRESTGYRAPLNPWTGVLPWIGVGWLLSDRRLRRRFTPVLLVAALGFAFWPSTIRDLRFLLPWLILLHAATAAGVDSLAGRFAPRARKPSTTWWVATLLAAAGLAWLVHTLGERWPLAITPVGREAYLAQRVDGYPAVRVANRHTAPGRHAYALGGARLQHFTAAPMLGDLFGPYRYARVASLVRRPRALHGQLRAWNVGTLVADVRRFPAFEDLHLEAPELFRRLATADGWQVFELVDESDRETEIASADFETGRVPRRWRAKPTRP